ncbi:MAG: hypothetical protein Q9186_001472 [Xanthomendoza sp. 1 TL-2023]
MPDETRRCRDITEELKDEDEQWIGDWEERLADPWYAAVVEFRMRHDQKKANAYVLVEGEGEGSEGRTLSRSSPRTTGPTYSYDPWKRQCQNKAYKAHNLQRPVHTPAAPAPFYGGGSGSNLSLSEYMILGLAAQGQAIYRFGGGMGDIGDMGGFGGFGGMGGFGGGGAVATRVLAGGQTVAAAPSKTASKGAKGGGDRVKQGRVSKQPPKAPGDGNSNQPAEGEGRRSRRRKSNKQPGQDGSGQDQNGKNSDPLAMDLDPTSKDPKDRSGQEGDDGSDKGPREPVPQND